MAPRLVEEAELLDRLVEVFRTSGYDGTSMADIARATGLQKSSLYHRFRGGKEQMAAEVIAVVGRRFAKTILAPLYSGESLVERVRAVGDHLNAFYDGGVGNCLLDVLSIGQLGPAARAALTELATAWVDAFAAIARQAGDDAPTAHARAEDAVAALEGALVLARVTGAKQPFIRAVERLPELLVGAGM